MALITCSECGNQVSDMAAVCPNCGAPLSVDSAAEERKCGECGAVLPKGANACPSCGCPVEDAPAPPAPPAQPAQPRRPAQTSYTAPPVRPARAQLGSAQARIIETVNRKTRNANVWLFFSTTATIVMFVIAFMKYWKIIDYINDILDNKPADFAAKIGGLFNEDIPKMKEDILGSIASWKVVLIAVMVFAAIAFISDLIRISGKKKMRYWVYTLPAVGIVGLCMSEARIQSTEAFKDAVRVATKALDEDNLENYVWIFIIAIAVLFFISIIVSAGVPIVTHFCPNCGKNIAHEGVGGICSGCNQRKYVYGCTPVPSNVVASYPYSGETLIGTSPVRGGSVAVIISIALLLFFAVMTVVGMITELASGSNPVLSIIISLAVVIPFTVFALKRGTRDKVIVTPTSVFLQGTSSRGGGRLKVPVSQITDVLTNEQGYLVVCAYGRGFIFTDLSDRARIAAALTALTAGKKQP